MHRYLIVLVTILGFFSNSATADEVWICDFPQNKTNEPSSTSYRLYDGFLMEMKPYLPFHILVDTDLAIVAASGEGIEPSDVGRGKGSNPIIGTETVAINRKTGAAARGFISLYPPNGPTTYGTCRVQTSKDPNVMSPGNTQKSGPPASRANPG